MLTEVVEHARKIEEKVKAMKSEIKKKYREPTVKGRKPGLNQLFGPKGRNKHPTRTE